jgi:CelD/BcsL family acetyltransferase involved in cellulose biosynthesis
MKEEKKWDIVEFKNIPQESDHCLKLKEILQDSKILFAQKETLNSPYIAINSDWETFYKNLSSKSKKTLRNIQNRLEKSGDVVVRKITEIKEFEEIKPKLYDIAKNSWTEEIDDSIYSERNKRFFDELSSMAAERGSLCVWLLQLNGEYIAFEYHLNYNKKNYALRSSFKKHYGHLSPGVFLDYHIVKELFNNDVNEYDLGGDYDNYKRKWTRNTRKYLLINLYNRRLYSKILYTYEYKIIPFIKMLVQKTRRHKEDTNPKT